MGYYRAMSSFGAEPLPDGLIIHEDSPPFFYFHTFFYTSVVTPLWL
jgi:hypothetical protein